MPLEIRELVIRTTVVEDDTTRDAPAVNVDALEASLVRRCVDAVLDELERRNER